MDTYTLNVGQGNLLVVVGEHDAVIVDRHIPPQTDRDAEFVKASHAKIVNGKNSPSVVPISAGIDNQFGRSHDEALDAYRGTWASIHSTHEGNSLRTYSGWLGLNTEKWTARSV